MLAKFLELLLDESYEQYHPVYLPLEQQLLSDYRILCRVVEFQNKDWFPNHDLDHDDHLVWQWFS